MKNIFISQSNYIPWKGYFDNIAQCDCFVIYDDMQFTKRDWRNRNYISTPNGLSLLTIPVSVKGKYFQKINETLISSPDWNKTHWAKIDSIYKQSPFYREIAPLIKDWYYTANFKSLTEINIHFLKLICDFLGIKTLFYDSRDFELAKEKNERLIGIIKSLEGTNYYTGPAAKNYIDENLFNSNGIEITYFNYSNYPEYHQNNPIFQHGVSIIDLIFNTGWDCKKYLKFIK